MRIRPIAFLFVAMVVATAACARASSEPTIGMSEPPGLLVVSLSDTSIFTIKPDGSRRTDLVAEQSGLVAIQPTWSPDGERLVWTEVDHMSEIPEVSIVRSGPGGEEVERTPSPVVPFYYYWNPAADQVAFLAGGPGGTVDLGLLNGDVGLLGEAQPFYFDWSPNGRILLTHTDLDAVSLLTSSGTTTTLEETSARFQAPQWAADGTRLVYAAGTPPATGGIRIGAFQANGQEIVVADTEGAILHRIGPFAGVATFELNADGRRIAHSDTLDRRAFNFGPLVVTDLDSGKATTVSQEPVLAYQWNPAGDLLLYLAAKEGIDHPAFRWAVWDGKSSTEYGLMAPTTIFASSYLPFWDQYSRSHRLWAPDGSAFAYSGQDDQGQPAIWVQRVGVDAAPHNVAYGDAVFWSPK